VSRGRGFGGSFFSRRYPLLQLPLSPTAPPAATPTLSSSRAPQGSTHPSIAITVQHSQPTEPPLQAAEEQLQLERGLPLQRAWVCVCVGEVEVEIKEEQKGSRDPRASTPSGQTDCLRDTLACNQPLHFAFTDMRFPEIQRR